MIEDDHSVAQDFVRTAVLTKKNCLRLCPAGRRREGFFPVVEAFAKCPFLLMPEALKRLDIMEGPVARGYVGYE